MLEITSKQSFDIFAVILVIAKYNLQTSISRKRILIEETIIPTDVLNHICKLVPNYVVRNYSESSQPIEISESHTELKSIGKSTETNTVKYKSIKKGDVFYCDFGNPYEHEIGYQRPAIVLWDFYDRCLVLPCTTNMSNFEGKFKISFKNENFKYYDKPMGSVDSMGIIGQLRVVDKSRLTVKVGTLTNEYFKGITSTIHSYFLFQVTSLSPVQLEMLNKNISKMQEIVSSSETNIVKISRILISYGFDLNTNGVTYLRDAILYSFDIDSFNITVLSQEVSKKLPTKVTASEVERVMIARFKEVFGKKYKTIDFIRLVKALL